MSDVIQKKKLAKALTKIEKCSLGKWYTGRTDGKTEEVVLMEDVERIILELLNEPTTKNDLGVASELDKNSKKLEKDFGESDCISRQATVKRLCNLAEFMNEHKEKSGAPYIMAALFIQDNKTEFPSVTPQEPRWIPVSERLPEEHKEVIASDVFGVYIGEFIDAEENWGGKHFVNEHGMHSKSVTAWMPLPEPYKAESEDKENGT